LTCISSELAGKRLQLLKELVPPLAGVAVLYNPEDRNKEWEYRQSQEAADKLKLMLRAYEARSALEIDQAFARLADDHAQALIIFSDVLTFAHKKRLADLALANGVPAMEENSLYVRCLLSCAHWTPCMNGANSRLCQ
jgi:putative tryptophan/tyrosine transport system substrate-binding protein